MKNDEKINFNKLDQLYKKIRNIHQSLEDIYPIAVVNNNQFNIYDGSQISKYKLIKTEKSPFPIPNKVRAAFPLNSFDNKIVVVVTSNIFNSLGEIIYIFHEFVHCFQFVNYENELREKLEIEKYNKKKENFMWEINHKFPYSNNQVSSVFAEYSKNLDLKNFAKVKKAKSKLKKLLSKIDYEYLIWQEWKEGFARYIENKIRVKLKLPENHFGSEKPLSRVSFYETGSKYIEMLIKEDKTVFSNLIKIYEQL